MKSRIVAVLIVGVAIFCLLFLVQLYYVEPLHADRTAALAVHANMTQEQVVKSLGGLYDRCKPGQYEDVDVMISRMQNSDLIANICCWRLSYSRDQFWVGFDKHNTVIATHLEKKNP